MKSDDLKRIFELKGNKSSLSQFIDELSQRESDWNHILLSVITASTPDLIEVLFDIAIEHILQSVNVDKWHHLLRIITANGFRSSYKEKALYPIWLSKMIASVDKLNSIKYQPNNSPNPKSIIVSYCLFHYLEAFTTVTEITKAEECPRMEVQLLKLITEKDESLLLFPFCYVVWDNINIFVGPDPESLSIPQLIKVNIVTR